MACQGSQSWPSGQRLTCEGGVTEAQLMRTGGDLERVYDQLRDDEERALKAGGAIKTGYLAALADKIDITATVDGDGQMDLSQITRLLDPIVEDEADYAKANRLLYTEYCEEMPPFRFVGNSLLTFLTKIFSGYWEPHGSPDRVYGDLVDIPSGHSFSSGGVSKP
jgi:hypothetical protein